MSIDVEFLGIGKLVCWESKKLFIVRNTLLLTNQHEVIENLLSVIKCKISLTWILNSRHDLHRCYHGHYNRSVKSNSLTLKNEKRVDMQYYHYRYYIVALLSVCVWYKQVMRYPPAHSYAHSSDC